MAAVTICSDFGAPKDKVWHCFYCFPIYFPWSDAHRKKPNSLFTKSQYFFKYVVIYLDASGLSCSTCASLIVAHGLRCPIACGILVLQPGVEPVPLHWKADSQPLNYQGSPYIQYFLIHFLKWNLFTTILQNTLFWAKDEINLFPFFREFKMWKAR